MAADERLATVDRSPVVGRVGRGGRNDAFYAALARDYMHLVELKERHPVTRLAELQGVDRETVRARVKEARKRELLAGPPGRPANKLTEKAQRILQEASQEERNAQV